MARHSHMRDLVNNVFVAPRNDGYLSAKVINGTGMKTKTKTMIIAKATSRRVGSSVVIWSKGSAWTRPSQNKSTAHSHHPLQKNPSTTRIANDKWKCFFGFAAKQSVDHMSAVECACGDEVERRHQNPCPACKRNGMNEHVRAAKGNRVTREEILQPI